MKQFLLSTLALLLGFQAIGQTTLPNSDFENWTPFLNGLYEEPSGGVWATGNQAITIPIITPPIDFVPLFVFL